MKTINVHNYEEFAIDYMVGNLSAQEAEAFTTFLAQHPDIADEVLLFETDTPANHTETVSFSVLKKEIKSQRITEDNFEEYCIADMEGDLDQDAQERLLEFIGDNTERLKVKSDFKQTLLIAETIEYPHKESLKRKLHKPLFLTHSIKRYIAFAAASIIAFGIFFIIPDRDNTAFQVADNTPSLEVNEPAIKTQDITNESMAPPVEQLTAKAEPIPSRKESKTQKETSNTSLEHIAANSSEGINNTNELLNKLTHKQIKLPENSITMNQLALVEPSLDTNIDLEPEFINTSLRNKTNKLIYSKVFAQSVKGINKMAETNLGYDVIEDEEGNPVRVIVKSRFGEIDRTLAQR